MKADIRKKLAEVHALNLTAIECVDDAHWKSIRSWKRTGVKSLDRLSDEMKAFNTQEELIEQHAKEAIRLLTEVLDEIHKPNITIMTSLGGIQLRVDSSHPVGRILFDNGFAINTEKVTVNGSFVSKDDMWEPLNKQLGYDCKRDMNYIHILVRTKNL